MHTRARLKLKVKHALQHKNDKDAWSAVIKKRKELAGKIASFRKAQLRLMAFISELVTEEQMALVQVVDL